ncbi:hypothetical protein [Roseibium aggregatum]|uniref:Uncharacterized protein n=1 Tax=Roseibium aggregatum TaxID=187304 RepID=A0A939J2R6_9HYPH|nr:hypothetical protein [Roseibium aggregatum]MBN9671698.1 hypothetical protein [Roseibium aggregatum]
MLKVVRIILFRIIPGFCTLYFLYFFVLGGFHPYALEYDIPYFAENCPALAEKVGPLNIEQNTEGDWSPFVTEYLYIPDAQNESVGALEIGRRNDLSTLSCFPMYTCLLPPFVTEKCEVVE